MPWATFRESSIKKAAGESGMVLHKKLGGSIAELRLLVMFATLSLELAHSLVLGDW
jgi:hypothetical protein